MKANSPPCPSSSPPSTARPQEKPPMRNRAASTPDLIANRPATDSGIHSGDCATARMSMPMPTDMKNRPMNKPLNGSTVISTSCRNSVSASSKPASSAPNAIDKPANGHHQQQTSQQSAQNQRQASQRGQGADAQGGQQGQRHEDVRLAALGEGAKQRADHAAPKQVNQRDGCD